MYVIEVDYYVSMYNVNPIKIVDAIVNVMKEYSLQFDHESKRLFASHEPQYRKMNLYELLDEVSLDFGNKFILKSSHPYMKYCFYSSNYYNGVHDEYFNAYDGYFNL